MSIWVPLEGHLWPPGWAERSQMPPQGLPLNKSQESLNSFIEPISIYSMQSSVRDAGTFKMCPHTSGALLLLGLNSCQVSMTSLQSILAPTPRHYSFPEHSQTRSTHHSCLCHRSPNLGTFCQAWTACSCDGDLTPSLSQKWGVDMRQTFCCCFSQGVSKGWLRWRSPNVWSTGPFPLSVLLIDWHEISWKTFNQQHC